LADRCYVSGEMRLSPKALRIGDEVLDPESEPYLAAEVESLTLPREAMGLGDVKFMAAIGAFLGWKATLFSLMFSSVLGAVVGLGLIALGRQHLSGRLPYGPYIAVAATRGFSVDRPCGSASLACVEVGQGGRCDPDSSTIACYSHDRRRLRYRRNDAAKSEASLATVFFTKRDPAMSS